MRERQNNFEKMNSPLSIIITTILVLLNPSLAEVPVNTNAIKEGLTFDFYKSKCPNVEKIIMDIMKKSTQKNPGWIPGILRSHFNDCFISGCDGSILLKAERYNSFGPESSHPGNHLRGFEAIEEMKTELEKQCPGVVSCADILTYAARDAAVLAGNSYYEIPAGRRDGGYVDGNRDNFLPGGSFKPVDLIRMYAERGLTVDDLVVLEGAHSIGQSRCYFTIADENNFVNASGSAEILDKNFRDEVMAKYCPKANQSDWMVLTVPLNPEKFDSAWGVTFYNNIMKGKGVLSADTAFAAYPDTKELVHRYASDSTLWMKKFGEAMIKLSKLNVLTGEEGDIRRHCGVLNSVDMPVQ